MNVLKSFVDRNAYWLSMPGAYRTTVGLVWVLDTGAIEIELIDQRIGFSTIYSVPKQALLVLAERLAADFGGNAAKIDELAEKFTTFLDIQSLMLWLSEHSDIPIYKRVSFHA